MTLWIGFKRGAAREFGRLEGGEIEVCEGDMFAGATPTGERVALGAVAIDLPCRPSKMIALWNNFHAAREKNNLDHPEAPLLFVKPPNAYAPSGAEIAIPACAGRAIFEADVTSLPILNADASFKQWTRSKGLDGFGPFGPVIATGLDPASLVIRAIVDGVERQNFPAADMMFSAAQLVAMISRGMTLEPGDIISCGTSLGAGTIKHGATVEIAIDGIGVLTNRFTLEGL
jgi:2-keto-4-pentenoate hydratase/2-oxohepta-3-ene-1,7-dioic acid hydratase in catechol pathway